MLPVHVLCRMEITFYLKQGKAEPENGPTNTLVLHVVLK
jgi:hypothetical protein